MTTQITEGISKALLREFCAEDCRRPFEIYSGEPVRQGLLEPCFFIHPVKQSERSCSPGRFLRESFFDIHYFQPEAPLSGETCEEVSSCLFLTLKAIDIEDGPLRGTGMRCESLDGVLHFYVNYNSIVMMEEKGEPMEAIAVKHSFNF